MFVFLAPSLVFLPLHRKKVVFWELSGAFWHVIDKWPTEVKRKFVSFVTGSDRLPLPGSELMRITGGTGIEVLDVTETGSD